MIIIISVIVTILILIIIGYLYKKSITCSDEECSNLVTLSDWEIKTENSDNVTLIKYCTNKKNNVDGCKQISTDILNKTINWTDLSCNTICGSNVVGYKLVNLDNKKIVSKITYPCADISCNSLVDFGNWTINNQDVNNITFNRTCTNKDANKNACNLIPYTQLNMSIQNIYPPSAVPQGSQTATINNITYTFTNDGCAISGNNAAWTFDKNNDTWTFFDGKGRYNTDTGLYEGTASDTNNIKGAWQQMQLSTPVLINGYYILTRNPFSEWYLFGSNNGSTWTQLDYRNINLPINIGVHFAFNNNTAFTHYRFVISRSIKNGNSYNFNPNLVEFYIFRGN